MEQTEDPAQVHPSDVAFNPAYRQEDGYPGTILKAKRYDGTTEWSEYIHHFKRVSTLNRWPKHVLTDYLLVFLDGEALAYAEALPEETKDDYEGLCRAMDERFGDCLFAQRYRAELKTRRRQEDESLPSLAQAINRLVLSAYPQLGPGPREELAIEYFTSAVDDREIRMALHQKQPKSVWEAVKVAVDLEAWKVAEEKIQFIQGRKAAVVQEEVDKNQKVITELTRLVEELKKRTSQRPEMFRRPRTCFMCGKEGHFARDCPMKNQQGKASLPQ